MEYGYIRVSTKDQHIDRQIHALKEFGLSDRQLFIDYESGKDFNRKNYQRLLKKIKKDDLVIIKSIDRLGRNYSMIIDEWRRITKDKDADIMVMDMPLLNTRIKGNNLVGKFISDVVLQVLSFVAQSERETMKQRQKEGIIAAKARGVKFGRPRIKLPNNFFDIIKKYKNKEINNKTACELTGLKRGTFFRYMSSFIVK